MTKVTVKEVKKSEEFKRGDIVISQLRTLIIFEEYESEKDTFSGFLISAEHFSDRQYLNTSSGGWETSKFSRFIGTVTLESS